MIDVREAIEEVRQRTGDQAYWHALEMVLGTLTARTLRSTLRLKIRGEDLSERERVAKGLAEIFSAQAATVDNLARREAALRGPRPREAALQELETHSHWVDFSDPANEARRAMGFVKRGIERGAKVVALLPSPDIEAYRRELVESECGEDLDSGRVSLESVDDRLEMLKTAGVLAVLLLSIQGLIQVARGQGYPEVWLVGKIARLGAPVSGPHPANRSGPGFPHANPPPLPVLSNARSFPGRAGVDGHVPVRPRLGLDPRHRAWAPAQLTGERSTQ